MADALRSMMLRLEQSAVVHRYLADEAAEISSELRSVNLIEEADALIAVARSHRIVALELECHSKAMQPGLSSAPAIAGS
ncbi:hypothetical protein [Methylobacterium sp. NEAU K]|uniref:hypothetical protein n=1 Tax=Methylobacterium sp. NEAU K TaxID=3064946 RepID=UPI002735C4E1|nr:hypothetical protein [Methylobacterium sp. NEAU K]MDP4004842.1 hypothetical protein [Methylobacterium sp. NEAU K]